MATNIKFFMMPSQVKLGVISHQNIYPEIFTRMLALNACTNWLFYLFIEMCGCRRSGCASLLYDAEKIPEMLLVCKTGIYGY